MFLTFKVSAATLSVRKSSKPTFQNKIQSFLKTNNINIIAIIVIIYLKHNIIRINNYFIIMLCFVKYVEP